MRNLYRLTAAEARELAALFHEARNAVAQGYAPGRVPTFACGRLLARWLAIGRRYGFDPATAWVEGPEVFATPGPATGVPPTWEVSALPWINPKTPMFPWPAAVGR